MDLLFCVLCCRRVDSKLCEMCREVDFIVLEGMGRLVQSGGHCAGSMFVCIASTVPLTVQSNH